MRPCMGTGGGQTDTVPPRTGRPSRERQCGWSSGEEPAKCTCGRFRVCAPCSHGGICRADAEKWSLQCSLRSLTTEITVNLGEYSEMPSERLY